MKKQWGPEIWEEKNKSHSSVGVILGTGWSKAQLDKNTLGTLEILQDQLLKKIPSGASVLDVGVGPEARFALALAKLNFHVTGLDGSETSLQRARESVREGLRSRAEKIEFVKADIVQFNLDRNFDAIICIETFFHLPGHLMLLALQGFSKHLPDGGLAFVQFAVQNEYGPQFFLRHFVYWLLYWTLSPLLKFFGRRSFVVTVTRNTDSEIEDMAQRSGFEVLWRSADYYLFKKSLKRAH